MFFFISLFILTAEQFLVRMETVEDDSGFKSEVKRTEFEDNEDTEESIEDISFNDMIC